MSRTPNPSFFKELREVQGHDMWMDKTRNRDFETTARCRKCGVVYTLALDDRLVRVDAWQTTCDARVAEMIAEGLLP